MKDLRRALEDEEKIFDLQQLQAYRDRLAQALGPTQRMSTAQQKLTMENIMKDPSIMQVLSTNPRGLQAIQETLENGPAGAEKYKDQPALYEVLKKLFDF